VGTHYVTGLRCMRCGRQHAEQPGVYVCDCRPNAGSDLGTLDVEYDYARISADWDPVKLLAVEERSIARFAPLLPVSSAQDLPPLPVGDTPLLPAPRLGEMCGLSNLFIKDDGRNPTGSLKDRASAIALARARAEGASVAATASTGNAAAALAGLCASVGQPNVIFVPETAPRSKLAQLLVYGSIVLAIRGAYDQAFDLCNEACAEFGWYNRNTGYNPYMSEGKKTVAYEIAAQLHRSETARAWLGFAAPNAVLVSVGDGCIIGGVYKGFCDLHQLGWIDRMPRIYGVQSSRSAALYMAWREGREVPVPVEASSRADSINVSSPRDAVKALRAVRETEGAFLMVSDEEILQSIGPLARLGAVFAEPAGAAAYAGLRRAVADGLIGRDDSTVIVNTGNGLKDIHAAIDAIDGVVSVDPTMEAVREVVVQRQ
jgi:threonine synthase